MQHFLRKIRWLTQRSRKEADLRDELQFHLEEEAERREAEGLRGDEAKSAARRELGNLALVTEDARGVWGWPSFELFVQDVRYSVRMLRKTPAFTLAAILSLALGIGANTAIFSLLNTVVLRTLPVPDPQQLVQFTYTLPLWETNRDNWNSWFGYPQLERFQMQSTSLAGIFGGTSMGRVNVAFGGTSGLAQGDAYSSNFFSVLGLRPQHGRFFTEADGPDATVVVLSDRYWRTRFGADPSVIDSAVLINQIPFTVIGITPPEFSGIAIGSGPDLWVPLRSLDVLSPGDGKRWTASFTSWILIAGRLRPDVSHAQAQAELDVIHHRQLEEQLSASELRQRENMQRFVRESRLLLLPAATGTFSGLRRTYALPLQLLMGVAGMVLLVACANVANLLLARGSTRRREIAVRLALGAGRRRVIRQLLTESLVLASIGGALALAIAWWGSLALVRMISTGDSPLPLDVTPDWRIFGFTAAVSLVTGVLFGLAPALRATRVDPGPALKEGARGARDSRRSSNGLDRILVVTQVALSVVLITGAGLFVRTLQKLWNVDVGYDRENVLMFSVDAKLAGYPTGRAGAVYREILQRLQAIPDVQSASASIARPVDDHFYLMDQVEEVDGRKLPEREAIRVAWNAISPGYFSTVSTPMILGRDFDLRDNEAAPKVVIINESLARRAFANQNPVGRRLGAASVIGVVKDSNYNGVRDTPRPVLYHPLFQYGATEGFRWGFVSYEIRHRAPGSLLSQIRHEIATVDRNLTIFRAKTLRTQAEQSLLKERLLAMLSTFFGALALLLACIGLYGLMAYKIARRTAEIGIRLALGARRGQVMWLVFGEVLWLTLAGIAIGIPCALWGARYAKSLLFGVSTADPMTIAGAIAILMAVAALAGSIPARRAVRVDPMVALRYE